MPEPTQGAQRASLRRARSAVIGVLAALILAGASSALAPVTQAATFKVVIVVGPVSGQTSEYRDSARTYASLARSYGASVTEIYSPYATWSKVKAATQGAKVLIYLGHGNGWPSPYPPFSTSSKDGMGLNSSYNAGNSNVKYYGEYYMQQLGLAKNAVVILNRLCYASGNNEWGAGNPTKSTAIKRVDNYGTGFLRGNAKAVFASGITSIAFVLKGLFKGPSTWSMTHLFWQDPSATGLYNFGFRSSRVSGAWASMDPYAPSRYYRSVIGFLSLTVGQWRSG